ncbi:MAG: PEP-CTERM sorting domain-containing protein [Phycisphaerae bacterium]|nr:PEP-CTERM sorting domain-containing protein [Phycisphaerae bacterium]
MRKSGNIVTGLLAITLFAGFGDAAVSIEWLLVEDPGGQTPAGYTANDLYVTVNADMGAQELIIVGNTLGDIYQDTHGSTTHTEPDPQDFLDHPAVEFDTYVTLGAWSYPTPTMVLGGAMMAQQTFDLPSNPTTVFDSQNLDIAWAPIPENFSGAGTFHIARVTIKNGLTLPYYYWGSESGSTAAEQGFIPEPATLSLLLVGGLAVLRRKLA